MLESFPNKTFQRKIKEMNDKQTLKQKEMLLACSQGISGRLTIISLYSPSIMDPRLLYNDVFWLESW